MGTRTRFAPAVGALLLLAGLTSPDGAAATPALDAQGPDHITVVVENRNFADMRVYAVRGGTSWRLGTVTGLTTGRLAIPRFLTDQIDEVQIAAIPIGGGPAVISAPVLAQAGDEIVFRVQPNAALSYSRVRTPNS